MIVGDAEGVMVIPLALVEEVVRDSVVQEDEEAFAIERVGAGEPTVGLFPLSKERRPEYEAWLAKRGQFVGFCWPALLGFPVSVEVLEWSTAAFRGWTTRTRNLE